MNFKCIQGQFNSFDELAKALEQMPKKQSTLLIGIDGCGGSGKSTFANNLMKACSHATVIHQDDFYIPSSERIDAHPLDKPIGADFDWKRVLSQILTPLSQNRKASYQRYDWETDSLAEWHTISVGGIVIIEGVYSLRTELADMYDYTIFVDCPRELRLARGIERDGEEARDIWENNWMIAEDMYMDEEKPFERANLVVSGTK